MKVRKFLAVLSLSLAFTMMLSACGSGQKDGNQTSSGANSASQNTAADSSGKGDPITIQIGSTLSETGAQGVAMAEFKRIVEEKTGGRITIDLKMNSVLGSEDEMLDQVKLGVIGGILTGGYAAMNKSDSRLAIEGLPFLFTDEEAARKAYNGSFGEAIMEIIAPLGYHPVCFLENGMRQMTNNVRPITTPDDLQGVKIRVVGEVRIKAFEAFGASPTTMAIGEVYSALQQGALDGQENPYSSIISRSFYDVQKYLSVSNHEYSTSVLMLNPTVWDNLSAEEQVIVEEAAKAAQKINYAANDEFKETAIGTCEAAGMQVNEVDSAAFAAVAEQVWKQYEESIGSDLISLAQESAK